MNLRAIIIKIISINNVVQRGLVYISRASIFNKILVPKYILRSSHDII